MGCAGRTRSARITTSADDRRFAQRWTAGCAGRTRSARITTSAIRPAACVDASCAGRTRSARITTTRQTSPTGTAPAPAVRGRRGSQRFLLDRGGPPTAGAAPAVRGRRGSHNTWWAPAGTDVLAPAVHGRRGSQRHRITLAGCQLLVRRPFAVGEDHNFHWYRGPQSRGGSCAGRTRSARITTPAATPCTATCAVALAAPTVTRSARITTGCRGQQAAVGEDPGWPGAMAAPAVRGRRGSQPGGGPGARHGGGDVAVLRRPYAVGEDHNQVVRTR